MLSLVKVPPPADSSVENFKMFLDFYGFLVLTTTVDFLTGLSEVAFWDSFSTKSVLYSYSIVSYCCLERDRSFFIWLRLRGLVLMSEAGQMD